MEVARQGEHHADLGQLGGLEAALEEPRLSAPGHGRDDEGDGEQGETRARRGSARGARSGGSRWPGHEHEAEADRYAKPWRRTMSERPPSTPPWVAETRLTRPASHEQEDEPQEDPVEVLNRAAIDLQSAQSPSPDIAATAPPPSPAPAAPAASASRSPPRGAPASSRSSGRARAGRWGPRRRPLPGPRARPAPTTAISGASAGRERGKERVVAVAHRDLLLLEALDEVEAHDLGRPGLSRHLDALHPRPGPGAALALDDRGQALAHGVEHRRRDRGLTALHAAAGLRSRAPRPRSRGASRGRGSYTTAAVGDGRVGDRELDRRHQVVALADGGRDGLALDPRLLPSPLLPGLGGDQPPLLSRRPIPVGSPSPKRRA